MGRPTKYDPAFCDVLLECMTEGLSKMAAAGRIGVCYDTITNWMAEHPEFFQAVKVGEAARAEFLERGLLEAETGPKVTSRIFALKNAAPAEWREKVSIGGDADAPPIRTEEVGAGLRQLSALVASIAERQSAVTDRDAGDPAAG